jgi:hypothetical protein
MYKVGINGGGTLTEVGDADGMQAFFDMISMIGESMDDESIKLITDRLYRRYVRLEDVEQTRNVLASIRERLLAVPTIVLKERFPALNEERSGILFGEGSVAFAFSKYFYAIEHCLEAAEVSLRYFSAKPEFGYHYEPVMVVRSEMPACIVDRRSVLSEHEQLDGPPVWLRPLIARQRKQESL